MKIYIAGSKDQTDSFESHLDRGYHDVSRINLLTSDSSLDSIIGSDDYYLILCDPLQYEVAKGSISDERIIRWYMFKDTLFDDPLKTVNDQHYTGIILGMSHSQSTLNESLLTAAKYYKVSSPSMDMFCHYMFLKKISETIDCRDIKSIVLEVPYYIFNYDLSQFGSFVYTKFNYFDLVGSFHNYEINGDSRCISEFRKLKAIIDIDSFKKKLTKQQNVSYARALYRNMKVAINAARNTDNVWKKLYPETIEENRRIYSSFLELVHERFSRAKLIILVMPFNPAFRLTHKADINSQKQVFYETMSNIKYVIDDFEFYRRSSFFADHCHIKKLYSENYTNHLNAVLNEIMTK